MQSWPRLPIHSPEDYRIMAHPSHPDSDASKGSVESDRRHSPADESSTESMAGQLGHRDPDEWIKESDTDFPEPGLTPEHSGQHQ